MPEVTFAGSFSMRLMYVQAADNRTIVADSEMRVVVSRRSGGRSNAIVDGQKVATIDASDGFESVPMCCIRVLVRIVKDRRKRCCWKKLW